MYKTLWTIEQPFLCFHIFVVWKLLDVFGKSHNKKIVECVCVCVRVRVCVCVCVRARACVRAYVLCVRK